MRTMKEANQAVIWQPFDENYGGSEPALLIQRDASGLLCIEQEGRSVLIQPTTLPALFAELKRLAKGGE